MATASNVHTAAAAQPSPHDAPLESAQAEGLPPGQTQGAGAPAPTPPAPLTLSEQLVRARRASCCS